MIGDVAVDRNILGKDFASHSLDLERAFHCNGLNDVNDHEHIGFGDSKTCMYVT